MPTSNELSRWAALVVIVLLAAPAHSAAFATGAAQQQRRPGNPRTSELEDVMRGRLDQAPAQFGALVSRVRVDVIVTDGGGNFVADLTAEDFAVFEDGEQQEILSVQLVDLPAGSVQTLVGDEPAAAVAAAEAGEETETAVDNRPANPANALGAVIFLIDAPSLDQQAKARFGDAWERLLEQTDIPRVPRAAYMFNNYGRIEELAPLGSDLATIRAAADTVRESPFFGNSMRRRMFEIANDLTNSTATRTQDLARQMAAAKARGFEVEERNRALATYELLTNLADALYTRSGRTAVVWVSTGIKLMQGGPFSALIAFDPRFASVPDGEPAAVDEGLTGSRFEVFSPDARIKAAQERLHRAANASNVSFYTIDPSLRSQTRRMGGDVEMSDAGAAQLLSTTEVEASLDAMRDSMRNAAAETGGRAFIQDTDIGLALARIESDTSRFYLISYAPPDARGDGSYHEIGVDVLREGVNVRARGGYVDYPAEDRARRAIEVALTLPGLATDLPIGAEIFRSRPPAGGPNLLSAVAVDGSQLGLAVGADGAPQVSLDVHTIIYNDDGIVDEAHEQLTARAGADGRFQAGGDLRPTVVGYLAYQHEWTLDPGAYTLNVAVLDNVTGRVGAASLDIEIAAGAEDWDVGDPLLATMDDSGRVQPVVLGRVLQGQSISVFAEVYRGVQPILAGQVFLAPEEGGNPQQGARLFPLAMRPAGPGLHRGSLLLPPGKPQGRYVVELQITDEVFSESEIVRVSLQVLALPGR
jgi:VWFA-related protein